MEYTGYTDPLAALAANQIANVRHDVAKVESELKSGIIGIEKSIGDSACHISSKIGDTTATILKDASDIAQRQSLALNAAERDLQNQILTNRYEAAKINTELSRYLADKSEGIKDRLTAFERNTDMQFQLIGSKIDKTHGDLSLQGAKYHGDLLLKTEKDTRTILEKMDAVERRSIKDELDETRLEKLADKFACQVSSQFALASQSIASLQAMVNSVDQNQKIATSQIQFGNGTIGPTTQSSNQVGK